MSDWPEKLEKLRKKHDSSPEQLAAMLGITTRTLSDFMKPEKEGGREPTKPIQRLVDNLLDNRSRPGLNLVLIHSDFEVSGDNDAVESVMALNTEASRFSSIAGSRQPEPFRNEYHFIAAPNKANQKLSIETETLLKKRIQPHYLTADEGVNTEEAIDVFFTATAMWLVSQALNQELAHVTIAANINKFWSLGKEIREVANVGVTFVHQFGIDECVSIKNTIEQCQIKIIAPPLGRCLGVVVAIHPGGYGFIKESTDSVKPGLFFSWNHMKLDENGLPEMEIQHLMVGDRVSYRIGVNNKGPCATDVAIVGRPQQSRAESASITSQKQKLTPDEQDHLKVKLASVIKDCGDAEGWALLSDIGSRIKLMLPEVNEMLTAKGYKLSEFIETHIDEFEYRPDGKDTKYSAACVRFK